MLKILFWDIDGTLIRTSKAGLYAFAQATEELWGKSVSFDQIISAGMTDNYIARQIIEKAAGREARQAEIDSLCRRYEEFLPCELAARKGLVLPGVANILASLSGRESYKLLLLTGNSRKGAEIKLEYFKLDQYFDFANSAFAEQYEKRGDIAGHALRLVHANWGEPGQHDIFVIGDTPHDIECGRGIGVYTIGIATGTYSVENLQSCCPWWCVEVLPEPEIFEKKLASM
ncbi:Pyrophosphatase PpaX [Sporomusa acidovorans DSM 3132]|uniref:Pyrophosphatase PpaX n=1 Tax=Sporomusa acidovorans (strain ATCC 49682 / DSM 3132 / Mol) TaxID=1123286 RepID=A0ABZ3IZM7_SPOA4|nr:pyrophosphatase PpaX [Sporomusa acidovorans DSM 3132]SDE68770.1 Phosphoglycolate phosphatase, HAD superfamily [Sporomusa acidovorans]